MRVLATSLGIVLLAGRASAAPSEGRDEATLHLSVGAGVGAQILSGGLGFTNRFESIGVPPSVYIPSNSLDVGPGGSFALGVRWRRFYAGTVLDGALFPQPEGTDRLSTLAFSLAFGVLSHEQGMVGFYGDCLLGFRFYEVVERSVGATKDDLWAINFGIGAGVAIRPARRLLILAPLVRLSVPLVFAEPTNTGAGVSPQFHLLTWIGAEVRFEFPLAHKDGPTGS